MTDRGPNLWQSGELALRRLFANSVLPVLLLAASSLVAQNNGVSPKKAPLVLTGAVPLPNVKGRIDHFALDSTHNRLLISALGNNTEEIIGIGPQTIQHTIPDLPAPQGVAYSPESNKIFVGSDDGKLYIYDGASFALIASIDFGDDVDNLRYDPAEKRLYVGYGDGHDGAIGVVDVMSNKRLEGEFKLGAHPEAFQLSTSGPNLYVNLPDLKQIAVVNRKTHSITRWPIASEGNFPMGLDESNNRLFVATRAPSR
jgi:DNA-binding beta-propeller fold protein YncE